MGHKCIAFFISFQNGVLISYPQPANAYETLTIFHFFFIFIHHSLLSQKRPVKKIRTIQLAVSLILISVSYAAGEFDRYSEMNDVSRYILPDDNLYCKVYLVGHTETGFYYLLACNTSGVSFKVNQSDWLLVHFNREMKETRRVKLSLKSENRYQFQSAFRWNNDLYLLLTGAKPGVKMFVDLFKLNQSTLAIEKVVSQSLIEIPGGTGEFLEAYADTSPNGKFLLIATDQPMRYTGSSKLHYKILSTDYSTLKSGIAEVEENIKYVRIRHVAVTDESSIFAIAGNTGNFQTFVASPPRSCYLFSVNETSKMLEGEQLINAGGSILNVLFTSDEDGADCIVGTYGYKETYNVAGFFIRKYNGKNFEKEGLSFVIPLKIITDHFDEKAAANLSKKYLEKNLPKLNFYLSKVYKASEGFYLVLEGWGEPAAGNDISTSVDRILICHLDNNMKYDYASMLVRDKREQYFASVPVSNGLALFYDGMPSQDQRDKGMEERIPVIALISSADNARVQPVLKSNKGNPTILPETFGSLDDGGVFGCILFKDEKQFMLFKW